MNQPYVINLPIKSIFTRVEDYVIFAHTSGIPFTLEQVVSSVFKTIQRICMYTNNWKLSSQVAPTMKIIGIFKS